MVRIEGGSAVSQATQNNEVVKPKPTPPVETVKSVVNTEKVSQMNTQAATLRKNLENKLNEDPEQQARQAAQQVAAAMTQKIPLTGLPDFVTGGTDNTTVNTPEAAAKKLRELTSQQSPEVAALTLKYSRNTIHQIAVDLSETSEQIDAYNAEHLTARGFFTNSATEEEQQNQSNRIESFQNTLHDLSVAADHASKAPDGAEAVAEMARPIAEAIAENGTSNFSSAFGDIIENGDGAKLALEVASQLNASGKTTEASHILTSIEIGIESLRRNIEGTYEAVTEKAGELNWLITNWEPLLSEDQLEGMIKGFNDANSEFVEDLEKLNQYGADALKIIGELGNLPSGISSLGNADQLEETLESFADNGLVSSAISQSTLAQEEAARQLHAGDKGRSFFENIGTVASKIRDGKGLLETTLNFAVRAAVESAADARQSGDLARVESILDELKSNAHLLGFNHPSLDSAIQHLGQVTRAESAEDVTNGLRSLHGNLNELQNQGVFTDQGGASDTFRSAGLILGAVGLGHTFSEFLDKPNLENVAQSLIAAVGFASDVTQTGIVKNLLGEKKWYEDLPVETTGKVMGGLGLALEAIGITRSLKKGDYIAAGLSTSSAVGGAMLLFGSSAAVTGVGAALVGVGLVGKAVYDEVKQATEHETASARRFLEGAGISADLANELINNDIDGRSPAPVFTALAEENGIDPREFFQYLSTLSPERASELIERAHGVLPDENGIYPTEKTNHHGFGRFAHTNPNPNDLTDLADWMRENGFAEIFDQN